MLARSGSSVLTCREEPSETPGPRTEVGSAGASLREGGCQVSGLRAAAVPQRSCIWGSQEPAGPRRGPSPGWLRAERWSRSKHVMTQNPLNQEDSRGVFGNGVPDSDWERAVPGAQVKAGRGCRLAPSHHRTGPRCLLGRCRWRACEAFGPCSTRGFGMSRMGADTPELMKPWRGAVGWGRGLGKQGAPIRARYRRTGLQEEAV